MDSKYSNPNGSNPNIGFVIGSNGPYWEIHDFDQAGGGLLGGRCLEHGSVQFLSGLILALLQASACVDQH